MIFITATDNAGIPTLFCMLSEADVTSMRQGRTVFVDSRATGGTKFNRMVCSLSPTDQESLRLIEQAGHKLPEHLRTHEQQPGEERCESCKGLMSIGSLFRGKCIVCWAQAAEGK